MSDPIETLGNSLVQHGPGNDRAYLLKLHPADAGRMVEILDELALSGGYSKVCARIPAWEAHRFVAAGYQLEAAIPDFYPQGGSACFMAKYFCAERKVERQALLVRKVLAAADLQPRAPMLDLPPRFTMRQAVEQDAEEMAAVYREALSDRPLAVRDPALLRSTMSGSRDFFCAWRGGSMVAVYSADIDAASGSAELADFANLPEERDHGLLHYLLQRLERHLLELGIRSVYTVTRAYSFDMNNTFAGNGYRYGGTLTNNDSISGAAESMNVWYKALQQDPCYAWSSLYQAPPGA